MVKIKVEFKPKERIIKSLIENKAPQPILALSGSAIVDYKNAYALVGDLVSRGIIVTEAIGRAKPVRLNISSDPEIFLVEKKRTQEFLEKNPRIILIQEDIKEIGYPFLIVLIFGSFAKGKNTSNSDIDICIISDNQEVSNKLIQKLKLSSLKLEIHEFTTKEFISMIEKKQNNVGNEIVKSNILLYGIENYYNLISERVKRE